MKNAFNSSCLLNFPLFNSHHRATDTSTHWVSLLRTVRTDLLTELKDHTHAHTLIVARSNRKWHEKGQGVCERTLSLIAHVVLRDTVRECKTFDHLSSLANRSFNKLVDLLYYIVLTSLFLCPFYFYRVFFHQRPLHSKWSPCKLKTVNWSVSIDLLSIDIYYFIIKYVKRMWLKFEPKKKNQMIETCKNLLEIERKCIT